MAKAYGKSPAEFRSLSKDDQAEMIATYQAEIKMNNWESHVMQKEIEKSSKRGRKYR